jgi:acyl carrier protein
MGQQATAASVQEFIIAELVDLGVEEQAIGVGTKIEELGIDSLDIAELLTSIEQDYGVDLPHYEIAGITLRQLVERIISKSSAQPA